MIGYHKDWNRSSSMKLSPVWCALLMMATAVFSAYAGEPNAEVTFNKDIAPIFYKNCVVCHHANDIAPMSLVTFKEVRPWAAAVREAVVKRTMPPWHADPNVGEYINDPKLSDADIATIVAWAKDGAKEGDPSQLPPAPEFHEGWHITPDEIISIPETVIQAGNRDDYEYIYVPTNFTEDKWIHAAEVMPGDRRV